MKVILIERKCTHIFENYDTINFANQDIDCWADSLDITTSPQSEIILPDIRYSKMNMSKFKNMKKIKIFMKVMHVITVIFVGLYLMSKPCKKFLHNLRLF